MQLGSQLDMRIWKTISLATLRKKWRLSLALRAVSDMQLHSASRVRGPGWQWWISIMTLQFAVQQLKDAGLHAIGVECDISTMEGARRVVDTTVAEWGQLDVLVNNAGSGAGTPLRIEEVTEEHFDKVFDWNVRSAFFCSKAALPYLERRKGTIVNLSSIAGRAGFDLVSPQYSASKAAVLGLTRNLAAHVGAGGVRVNAVAPGFIRTGPRQEAIWQLYD
jgi:NAD(P)-dependent dehydrogenase (short-subunit alcohol dehydrogenase family)